MEFVNDFTNIDCTSFYVLGQNNISSFVNVGNHDFRKVLTPCLKKSFEIRNQTSDLLLFKITKMTLNYELSYYNYNQTSFTSSTAISRKKRKKKKSNKKHQQVQIQIKSGETKPSEITITTSMTTETSLYSRIENLKQRETREKQAGMKNWQIPK